MQDGLMGMGEKSETEMAGRYSDRTISFCNQFLVDLAHQGGIQSVEIIE